jgi:hypothetical protein
MTAGIKANVDGSAAIQVGGTDYITISSAGAVAIPQTLAVPTIKSNASNTPPTIQDSAGTQIGTFCRAWVNFNGTTNTGGFCTIRASFNVTTVADNGVGLYTVNFTNAMPDANYVVTCETAPDNAAVSAGAWLVGTYSASGSGPILKTASAVQLRTSDLQGSGRDIFNGGVAIFR